MKTQILIGQRQHGDLGEVHLLRARQRQQHVERALEAVQADDQGLLRPDGVLRGLPSVDIGLEIGLGLRRLGGTDAGIGHAVSSVWKTCESLARRLH